MPSLPAESADASGLAPPRPSRGGALIAALPGLLLAALLGAAAFWLAELPWVRDRLHWSALLLVILIGMALKSLAPIPDATLPGVRLAHRPILRWAVAGLGFRLSLPELWSIGAPALLVVSASTLVALLFGWWIARRLGVPEKLGLLLGVGGAICGASAVVAADSVVQGERRDAPLALGVITLLGTIGIVLYPALERAARMSDFVYGVWDGASLHEMAQVVAAGFGVSEEAARVATVVKLARICLLAPVVLYLGWTLRRHHQAAAWNSTGWLAKPALDLIRRVDLWLLCVGMAGVGLQTGLADLRAAGLRPIAAATFQWLVLGVTSYSLAAWLCR